MIIRGSVSRELTSALSSLLLHNISSREEDDDDEGGDNGRGEDEEDFVSSLALSAWSFQSVLQSTTSMRMAHVA